ncbi:putative uncharacterized protein [Brachyspira sp. CAG:484]|nr:putative uncharacterized protein [Brachyspira sp. CAG:484]
MSILKYLKEGPKIQIEICGLKLTFHLPEKKNYYISLGTNCFVRMAFTKFYLKPARLRGELTCPFDLCVTPVKSLAEILENEFSDYFNDVEFDEETNYYINRKYLIHFIHDGHLTRDEFLTRYKKRVENFLSITKDKAPKKYILCCDQNDLSVDVLNRIYNSLLKLRNGKPFKFYVINFLHDNPPKIDLSGLNRAILYNEFDITNEYNLGWLKNFDLVAKNLNPDILKKIK